jgi:tetratricopeptide (TPR) repeat protein
VENTTNFNIVDGSILNEVNFDHSGKVNFSEREYGKSIYRLAKLYYDKSDLGKAFNLFNEALSCCELPRDCFVVFKIYGFLIRISSESLRNDHANSYIEKAQKLIDRMSVELPSLNSEFFYNSGVVKNYLGDFSGAKSDFEFALSLAVKESEPELQAKILLSIANNNYNLGLVKEAVGQLNKLEELLHIVNKNYLKGAMYLFWSKILLEQGMCNDSLEKINMAIVQLKEKKCWNLYGHALLRKGQIYKKLGDYEKSLVYFNLSTDFTDSIQFRRLTKMINNEINEVNDSSIDIYLDRANRKVVEKTLGTIDFKHRFVLLEILFLLARNTGEYYDKEQLAKSIWKDEYNPLIHDKLIYTSVSRLRKLIEPKGAGEKRKYIVRGKDGYTFNPRTKIRFQNNEGTRIESSIANIELTSPV